MGKRERCIWKFSVFIDSVGLTIIQCSLGVYCVPAMYSLLGWITTLFSRSSLHLKEIGNKLTIVMLILGTRLAPQQAFEKLLINWTEHNYVEEAAREKKKLWVQRIYSHVNVFSTLRSKKGIWWCKRKNLCYWIFTCIISTKVLKSTNQNFVHFMYIKIFELLWLSFLSSFCENKLNLWPQSIAITCNGQQRTVQMYQELL